MHEVLIRGTTTKWRYQPKAGAILLFQVTIISTLLSPDVLNAKEQLELGTEISKIQNLAK